MCHVLKIIFSTAIIAVLFSCNPSKKINTMEKNTQLYYTQEGSAYRLKVISNRIESTVLPAGTFDPWFIVGNTEVSLPINYQTIQLVTSKSVVPVYCVYSIYDIAGNAVICTIATPYSSQINGGAFVTKWFQALNKIVPNADMRYRDATTPNNFTELSLRYNQIVLSDEDFISPADGNLFIFTPNLGQAYGAGLGGIVTLGSANVRIEYAVTYFQLD
jgi:hypothetical protein